MKGELQMIKELVVGAMLASGVTQVAAPQLRSGVQQTAPQATWSYVSELQDGAVYFIRNVADDDKVMDVYNHDYNNGRNIKLWDSNGYGNQRFIARKRVLFGSDFGTNGREVFTFTPINAQDKCLTIQGVSNAENKRLQIRPDSYCDAQTNVRKYSANAFLVEPGITNNSLRILTGASDYTKYLTTYNYGTENETEIVQKSYNSSHYQNYEWYFQRVDTLGLYAKNEAVISGQNWQQFWLKVPSDGVYTIQTLKREYNTNVYIDTVMELTDDENGNSWVDDSDDDDYRTGSDHYLSRIDHYLAANHSYGVRVKGCFDSDAGDIYIDVVPQKAFTVFHNNVNLSSIKTNTKSYNTGWDSLKADYNGENIVYQEFVNAGDEDFIKANGVNLWDSYYSLYMWDFTFGGAIGPDDLGAFYSMTSMSNSKLAIFGYGGSKNIASLAHAHGAEYAIGFERINDFNAMKFACRMFSILSHEAYTVEAVFNQTVEFLRMSGDAVLYH